MRRARDERGVALPLVLAVLVCLIAVAIPFSLSMRHEQGGVAYRASDDEARRSVMEVRDLALAHLGATAPERDATPWCDGPGELALDLDAAARALSIEDLGPRGRLLSAEIEDQSGRIDLNRANLFLVARMLGLSTTLATRLKPEDRTIRLADGDFLQESGHLWIDGEITSYQRHDGATVQDFVRPSIVPGLWEPAQLATEAREHEAGTEVIDFRAWLVAAWAFKAQAGIESRFETVGHPLAIAGLGQGALGAEQRARLEEYATIWAADGGRDRFGNSQRVLSRIEAGQSRELLIEQGQFVGRGTVARVTNYRGEVDYGFVLRSTRRDEGAQLVLEMPLRFGADAGAAHVEFLLPRPVNVNSCSRETLVLLLDGLKLRGATKSIDPATARKLAERIEKSRPIDGLRSLVVLLDEMVQKEKSLDGELASAVLRNAEHSGCFDLEVGSAPFGYTSDGVVEVRAAASLNYELNGRERARAFVREVVSSSAAGPSARLFKVQRDFDEPWRISRMARGWTTFPENLQLWGGGIGEADPPSRLLSAMSPRLRYPSEEISESGARLATGWYEMRSTPFDHTWHFDGRRGDFESQHPEGWRLVDGAVGFHPDGSDPGVPLTINLTGEERPRPFGVSLWWNPGTNLGSEQTLFDWKCNGGAVNPELSDRVRLRFLSGKLEFEVDDAFLRQSEQDLYTSKIVYDFTDGMPLEGDTWYHVTAFCRGNRAGQMSLWIDGKPRGKWSHYTRLSGSFTAGGAQNGRIAIDATRLPDGLAKFPPRGALRVGNDVVEYSSASGAAFVVTPDPDNHFGGTRPAPSLQQSQTAGNTTAVNHPSTEGVELYGYAARLESDLPAGSVTLGSDGLAKFGVAMVAKSMAKKPIEMAIQNAGPGGGGGNIPLGRGFDSDETTIDLAALDGGKLSTQDPPLLKSGGYAALVGYYFGTLKPRNSNTQDEGFELDSHQSTTSSWVQGVEVIHYGGYDGGKLTNVKRGQTLQSELGKTDLQQYSNSAVGVGGAASSTYHFLEKHAFIVMPDSMVWGAYKPGFFVTLVVPLSVVVSGSPKQSLLVPEVDPAGYDHCEMAQIGEPESEGVFTPTEWIRYDAIVQDQNGRWNLLRSDPKRLAAANWWVQGDAHPTGRSDQFNGTGVNDRLWSIANAPASYGANSAGYDDLCEDVNRENLLGGDPDNSDDHRLAFRGVCDTWNENELKHESGATIYPVWRTGRSGPLPGRYDEITIVGSNNERPERHFLNYAWSQDSGEDWPNACHCALLATTAATTFRKTPSLGLGGNTATNAAANIAHYGDSRNYARILKFPSGELPSVWDRTSDLVVGGQGGDGAMVDEVRLFATEDPLPIASLGMHALERELTVGENSRMQIIDDHLRFPHGRMGDIGATPLNFHEDACVWQIGDEFILGGERNQGKPVVQEIAADGRIRFSGSDRFFAPGYHAAGSTLQILPWFVMTRLANGVSTSESRVALTDPDGFPMKGCVMIDQEVLAYTARLTNEGPQPTLYVPTFLRDPDGRSSGSAGEAAFRGRYGTPVMTHAADAVVFFWPWRYPDGYQTRCDAPEMATLEIPIAARRGLFHALTWSEEKGDPLAKLVATVRVQGKGGFAVDPDADDDLFVFDSPGTRERPNRIDRQGDVMFVRLNVDYLEGALDPVDFTKNSWKRAPIVEVLAIESLADRVVELHEESR